MSSTGENQNHIGIFTTDAGLTVRVWDAALERMTGIRAADALGKPLLEIIPDLETRGLLARLRRVLEEGTVEILAPAFHRFLISCPPPLASARFAEMRQRVSIAPLRENETIRGLIVTIEDVTDRIEDELELADRLKNESETVRLQAAKEIAERPENLSEDTAAPIIDALGDKNWRVRRELVEGLARRAAPDAIAALLRAMQHKHLDFAVLNSALSVLQATSVETTGALLDFLAGDDADLRMQAALTLGELRDARAVPALLGALGDENANVRFHAVEALGKLRAREASAALLAIAETRDFFLSFAALEALRRIGDPSVAPRLLPLLADAGLREAAIETLGAVGDPETVSPLIIILNDNDADAPAAAHALGALIERFADDPAKRAAVLAGARAEISESGKNNLLAALDEARETESIPLIRLAGWFADEKIAVRLARFLENAELRDGAARALVHHGASAVDLLIEKLDEAETKTLPAIIRSLAEIGDARAFEPLVELLQTGDGALVRQTAVEALQALAHPETVPRLCELLNDSEIAVREAALRVIGHFSAAGCEDLFFDACRDADERIRRAALEQLPSIADERSLPALIRALKTDSPRVRQTAAKALARVKGAPTAIAALREALADTDSWTRYFAVRSLGALDDPASREKISEMAERDDAEHVRAAAREVLGASQ